jgi:hypothetical protein
MSVWEICIFLTPESWQLNRKLTVAVAKPTTRVDALFVWTVQLHTMGSVVRNFEVCGLPIVLNWQAPSSAGNSPVRAANSLLRLLFAYFNAVLQARQPMVSSKHVFIDHCEIHHIEFSFPKDEYPSSLFMRNDARRQDWRQDDVPNKSSKLW